MKKTIVKEFIPPQSGYTREIDNWVCDVEGCDFSTDSEEEANNHFASLHSFKAERKVGDTTFLWFENKENYRAYFQDSRSSGFFDLSYDEELFIGPGWYALTSRDIDCRCGHCDEYVTVGTPISEELKEAEARKKAMEYKLELEKKYIADVQKMIDDSGGSNQT